MLSMLTFASATDCPNRAPLACPIRQHGTTGREIRQFWRVPLPALGGHA